MQKLEGFRLDGIVQKMKCPFLLLHGAGDEQIPLAIAEKCFAAVGSKEKTLKVFQREEGGFHHCQVEQCDHGTNYMWDWAADVLKPGVRASCPGRGAARSGALQTRDPGFCRKQENRGPASAMHRYALHRVRDRRHQLKIRPSASPARRKPGGRKLLQFRLVLLSILITASPARGWCWQNIRRRLDHVHRQRRIDAGAPAPTAGLTGMSDPRNDRRRCG